MHRPDVKLQHGQAHRQQDKGDGEAHPLGAGVEVFFQSVEGKARHSAQTQGEENLADRLHQDADHVDVAFFQGVGDAEGDREEHQAHGVVDGHHHQEQVGQGAVGLVLLDHHQGCRGSGSRRDGAQGDGRGRRDHVRPDKVEGQQGGVHHQGGDDRLQNADGDGLAAHALELAEPELVADHKGDEAQRHLGDDVERLDLLEGGKADEGQPQPPDQEGPQQQARHQIGGDGGQVNELDGAGHQKSRDQADGQGN